MSTIVRTVRGDIAPEALGFTTLHDHTVVSLEMAADYMKSIFPPMPSEMTEFVPQNYWLLKSGAFLLSEENRKNYDLDVLEKEFGYFKALGGQSVFDPSPIGYRGPIGMIRELSERTGLNIVVATGLYHETTIPQEYMGKGEDFFYGLFKDEVERGIEGTDIRPGALKCAINVCGPNEIDVVNAVMRLQAETGMSAHVHTEATTPDDAIFSIIDGAVKRYGADPTKVVVCHIDSRLACSTSVNDYLTNEGTARNVNLSLARRLLAEGYNVGLDTWCLPVVNSRFFMADRFERAKALVLLCDEGYAGQISLGNDFSSKICCREYGEYGPTAFVVQGFEFLKLVGREHLIPQLVFENPRRILAFG